MSEVKVNKISPRSGTAVTLGDSGDKFTVPSGSNITINSGASITNDGTATGFDTDTNDKVKVSANDTTPGFLNGKLVAGTNISLTEGSDGGNETLTAALSGTITPSDNTVTLAKMAPGTDGNIISYDASGNPVAIATGSDGQVLTSAGAGAQPAFEALPSSGKILQVLQNLEGNTRSTIVTSFQNIVGIEQAITPSASNSKVLVSSVLVLSCGNHGVVRFIRVTGGVTTVIGAGTTASGQQQNGSMTSNSDGNTARPQPFQFLDSPGTTSTVTYYAQWIANSSTPVYLNRTPNDANEIYGSRFSSTITLMEVGA